MYVMESWCEQDLQHAQSALCICFKHIFPQKQSFFLFVSKYQPRLAPFTGGLKFAAQISPLLIQIFYENLLWDLNVWSVNYSNMPQNAKAAFQDIVLRDKTILVQSGYCCYGFLRFDHLLSSHHNYKVILDLTHICRYWIIQIRLCNKLEPSISPNRFTKRTQCPHNCLLLRFVDTEIALG